ncbi:hypothetical protein ABZX92_07115 [Lentzea sp. NPDC006480]|uniref:hypothetical protein n=1 Tax=Lentzea sp. NPDC006480 TaxID=3157176 RepID=UPI0033B77550
MSFAFARHLDPDVSGRADLVSVSVIAADADGRVLVGGPRRSRGFKRCPASQAPKS